jgi:hypothetical protein
MTASGPLSATAIAEAVERRIGAGGDEDAVLGAVVYPLMNEHGAEAVLAELGTGRENPLLASALAYAASEADVPLNNVFTSDEIVTAAHEYLLTVGSPAWEQSRLRNGLSHGHWAWFALFDHHPGNGDFEDGEHFRLVLKLIEIAPLDDTVLFLIGDGPLAHSAAVPEHLARIQELAKTDPKIARAWWLNETDGGHLAK